MSVFEGRPDLLARFRDGNRDALETVYRAHVGQVSEIVVRGFRVAATGGAISGLGRHPADLADTVQEIFSRAFSRAARTYFDGARDFGAYLAGIARNVMVDRARSSGREILLPEIHFEAVGISTGSDPYADLVKDWEDADAIDVAQRFIQQLPPDLARVHRARYVDGLSQREAAVHLGITRQRLRTAEGKLREGLRTALLQRRSRVEQTQGSGRTSSRP